MIDWLGSIKLCERSSMRVVLSVSRGTRITGWAVLAGGVLGSFLAWPVSTWLVLVPGALAALGLLVGTLRREFVFDREAGVLKVEQGTLGLCQRATVPLFHLRAVVIVARSEDDRWTSFLSSSRYVAYLDRRVGDAIYLDESRRCAELLPMAEAIADLAELRLEYDATSRASGDL